MGWSPPADQVESAEPWTPPPDQVESFSDMGKNIIPNATDLLKGSADTAMRIGKGINDFPMDATKTAIQELGGTNPMETPIGQDIKTIGGGIADTIKGIPGAVADLGSKDAWINKPVSNALTAYSLVDPLINPAEGGMAEGLSKSMRDKGANMAADLESVPGSTISKMKPDMMLEPEKVRTAGGKSNPADLRTETGARLVKEGVVGGWGQDAGDRWQETAQKHQEYGKAVDSALDAIRKENRSTGEWDNVEDPLHKDAQPILLSLKNKELELANDPHSANKQTSRYWKESYNALADKANASNGRLTLDDLRDELQEVGDNLNKSTDKSPRFNASKEIYGHLADLRDNMVNEIAQESGKPELAKNLLDANKGYSFYSRVLNGISTDAAQGASGAGTRVPTSPERAVKRGVMQSLVGAAKPATAEKLINYAPTVKKFGGVAEKIPGNLMKSQVPQEVQDYLKRRQSR